jgi:hypothetical protein
VRWERVVGALQWLIEHNPLYTGVEVEMPPEALVEEAHNDDAPDPFRDLDPREMQHSTMMPAEQGLRRTAMRDQTARARAPAPLTHTMGRNLNAPVSFYTNNNMEALANVFIYPKGKNHWGSTRNTSVHKLQFAAYMRQRIMNVDRRCQHPGYLAWAVSVGQHRQLCGAAGVAVRWRRGGVTVGEVRRIAELEANPEAANETVIARAQRAVEIGEKCWSFMRNVRGTASYWRDAGQDLFAMIKHCGAPTWFMTFSANDLGWDDLAVVLARRKGQNLTTDEQVEEFLENVTDQERKEMMLNDPVTVARHFDNRWRHFFHWLITDPSHPVGNVTDYFWRVEFQRRGSPHIHMMLWVDGAPNLDTVEGRLAAPAWMDKYVKATIPEEGQEDDWKQQALRRMVLKTQQHQHTHTCTKGVEGQGVRCRFR